MGEGERGEGFGRGGGRGKHAISADGEKKIAVDASEGEGVGCIAGC